MTHVQPLVGLSAFQAVACGMWHVACGMLWPQRHINSLDTVLILGETISTVVAWRFAKESIRKASKEAKLVARMEMKWTCESGSEQVELRKCIL